MDMLPLHRFHKVTLSTPPAFVLSQDLVLAATRTSRPGGRTATGTSSGVGECGGSCAGCPVDVRLAGRQDLADERSWHTSRRPPSGSQPRRRAEMSSGPQADGGQRRRRRRIPPLVPAPPLGPTSTARRLQRQTPGNGKEQPMRACASSVIPPVASSFARQCQVPDLKEASNSR